MGLNLLPYLRKLLPGADTFPVYFLKRLEKRAEDHEVLFAASSIAFNAMVTILPLAILLIILSSTALQSSAELREGFHQWLEKANPFIADKIRLEIENVLTGRSGISGIAGLAGIATLLWFSSRLFGGIRTALRRIFGIDRRRNILKAKLYDIMLVLLTIFCFFSAFLFAAITDLVTHSVVGRVVSSWPVAGVMIDWAGANVLALSFTVLLFFLLYWAGTDRTISWLQAVSCALIATGLTAVGTVVYKWVLSRPTMGFVYGSLAAVMATFLWLYWVCVIFLLSAEATEVIREWLGERLHRTG